MSDWEKIDKTLAEADQAIEQTNKRLAEEEQKHGPSRSYVDLRDLLEGGLLGDGVFVKIWNLPTYHVELPFALSLYCSSEKCGRMSEFFLVHPAQKNVTPPQPGHAIALTYACRFCDRIHTAALQFKPETKDSPERRFAVKVGEWPPNIEPLSKALLKFAGSAGPMLKKGYECEKLQYGIGAFGYYRKAVDLMWRELLGRIASIAGRLHASSDGSEGLADVLADLDKAERTQNFEHSINRAADHLPVEMLIDGKNPLTLLYRTISAGLHNMDDQACLDRAEIIREVLELTVERLNTLKLDSERIKKALGKLERAARE